jgi:hypothetical protein
MRLASTDDSSSNYAVQRLSVDNTTVNAARTTSQSSIRLGAFRTSRNSGNFYLINPFASLPTHLIGSLIDSVSGVSSFQRNDSYASFSLTTSFDGFSIIPASGNITGTFSLYGLAI